MALPSGVLTSTLRARPGTDATGAGLITSISVDPVFGGSAQRIIWAATMAPFVNFTVAPPTGQQGVDVTLPVPVTDQAGWIDSSGHAITNFGYKVTVTEKNAAGTAKQWVKNVSPLTADAGQIISLEGVPDGELGAPVQGPLAVVTSLTVNGGAPQTGAVSITTGGGGGGGGAVDTVNNVVPDDSGNVQLDYGDVGADQAGAANSALTAAEAYTDNKRLQEFTATAPVSLSGQRITNVGLPTVGTDALSRDAGDSRYAAAGSGGGAGVPSAVSLDSFVTGGTDDQKLAAAISYVAAQTYKPVIYFSNRQYSFANNYPLNVNGLRFKGDQVIAREFRSTNRILCPAGGLFSINGSNKDFGIQGLSFEGTGQWMTTTASVLTDCDILDCGFQGFSSVANIKITRCNFDHIYINGCTNTALTLGGSDSVLFQSGQNYIAGQIAANQPYVQFGSMSQTVIGKVYYTPTKGYAFKSTAGDDAEGLIFENQVITAFGQGDPSTAPPSAGIQIAGGTGIVFDRGAIFNVNCQKLSKGWMTFTGGQDHVVQNFTFVTTHNGFTSLDNDANTCAIFTQVPITVVNPISAGGFPKRIKQSQPGLVRLVNAPGWSVVTGS